MRTLILENELIRVVVLLDKGSDIIEFSYKPLDLDVMWHSPTGYRNPQEFTPSLVTAASPFLDLYGGGWQDLLPVIGHGPISHRGAEFGLHGETALLAWEGSVVEEGPEMARAVLRVRGVRYPYEVEKVLTVRRGEAKLRIWERLTNTSRQELEFFWLQHPAYGEPFLEPGCRVDLAEGAEVHVIEEIAPQGRLAGGTYPWPRVRSREGDEVDLSLIPSRELVAEETAFIRVEEGWYALTNPRLRVGVALYWSREIYPWLWFWQNYNLPNYPWYGEAWNVALEPSTSFPATTPQQLEAESYLRVPGQGSVEAELVASLYTGLERVEWVSPEGDVEGR
jgi:hypothetical protein